MRQSGWMRALPLLALGCASAPLTAQSTATLLADKVAALTCPPGTKVWADRSQTPECRARAVLAEFRTLEEKLFYLSPPPLTQLDREVTAEKSSVRNVMKELGFPEIAGSDGPAGITRGATATAFPSPLSVAASFDRAVATRYGTLMGQEFRAAGLGTILGPAFDIARSWKFGRLSESFGEDPFLTAQMSGAEVKAIQAQGVVTVMKHYAGYAQEAGRVGDGPTGGNPAGNNIIGEKALREIYLPGFEAAVKEGRAGGVMCAFPRINGVYACENKHLFDILKSEWGFDGVVMPDFPSGQRSITRAFMAGLDSGAFGKNPLNAALDKEKPMRQALADGEVPEKRIDDIILRKLIPAFRVGQFDRPPVKMGDDVSTPATRAAAAEMLADGSVLLRNEKGILPFGPEVRSIAVIGLQATDKATVVEQGSPWVKPVHLVPALDAIRARAMKAGAGQGIRVDYAPGTSGLDPLPAPAAGLFTTPEGKPGFRADFYANPNLDMSGQPFGSLTLDRPGLDKEPGVTGLPASNQWSVRYAGRLTPKTSGIHKFSLHGSGTARLFIDGVERGHFELADFGNAIFANVPLIAGKPVNVRIDYTPRSALGNQRRPMFGMNMGLTLEFGYAPPDSLIADAARAAKAADVAVVFVGEKVGEGMDRHSLSLQGDQDALIAAVAKANPRTVVVLNTGGAVAMPWLRSVAGVMEMWLPGDAFGTAAAAMLFGDAEPAGRLPVTFPADETQGPATQPRQFPGLPDPRTGQLGDAQFDEGVLVGYRYWDAQGQVPLFPFGHGLGYGAITLSGGKAELRTDGSLTLRATLRNDGKRRGTEVAQLYLGFPEGTGEPPRQLKGVSKVVLEPGASREVEITVPRERLRHWDEKAGRWRVASGAYTLSLGRSSRDIVWEGVVTVVGD